MYEAFQRQIETCDQRIKQALESISGISGIISMARGKA
jgi:hypothetical protein